MKKILLTGAGGSIGVHFLAHIMHNTDWSIIATDSFRHKGQFDRIVRICQDNPEWQERIRIISHDLSAPFSEKETEELEDIDYIINLASLSDVKASIDDPVPFIRNNVEIILNMLELARKIKPEVFLQVSTDEVMGPAKIDHQRPEWSTILPSNPYAASKACQEAIALSYWRSYTVPLILVNATNNFGEMQQSAKYAVKIQKAVKNDKEVIIHTSSGGQIGTRYYIHSRNTADAVLFILENTKPYLHKLDEIDRPDRYNIVGDIQLNNLELAEIISKLMNKELKYRLLDFPNEQPGHDIHYGLDGSKLRKLGWTAPHSFEESMKNTIEWQEQNPEWIQ